MLQTLGCSFTMTINFTISILEFFMHLIKKIIQTSMKTRSRVSSSEYQNFYMHTFKGNISEVTMNISKCRSDNALRKLLRGCLLTYSANEWKS